MSSWDPSEKKKADSSHDPGVKGKDVQEGRDLSDDLFDFNKIDCIMIGVFLSIPAGFLTVLLLWEFFPQFQNTAGNIVRDVIELFRLVYSSVESI